MSERRICTHESPYNSGEQTTDDKWQHPDAQAINLADGYPGGDIATYLCPNCGLLFQEELPQ